MRRTLLGIISAVLIAAGLMGISKFGANNVGAIALFRAGLVLGALWLALPQLMQTPPWAIIGTLVGLAIVAIQPKLLIVVAALAILYGVAHWALRLFVAPRSGRRVSRTNRGPRQP